ncbi:MAG: hypothetical protein V3W18_08045 [candidate division Zixibacteria bacterium]
MRISGFILIGVFLAALPVSAQEIDSVGCYEHLVFDVFVVDTLAYLTSGPSNVFMVMNVADPSNPILLGEHFWEGNT